MPAYKLAADSLENLLVAATNTHNQIRATAAYLEQMDPHRSLTQEALLHNALAEGEITTTLRQIRNLREQVRRANGGKVQE